MSTKIDNSKNPEFLASLPIIGITQRSEKEEKHLREVVEFEFNNLEEPGLTHKFVYGDTKRKATLEFWHGGKYRVPRFIARFLESRSLPIWEWRPDGSGKMVKKVCGNRPRFQMRESFS